MTVSEKVSRMTTGLPLASVTVELSTTIGAATKAVLRGTIEAVCDPEAEAVDGEVTEMGKWRLWIFQWLVKAFQILPKQE